MFFILVYFYFGIYLFWYIRIFGILFWYMFFILVYIYFGTYFLFWHIFYFGIYFLFWYIL